VNTVERSFIIGVSVIFLLQFIYLAIRLYGLKQERSRHEKAFEAEKLRSEAITQWVEVNQKIRNGEASIEDLELSFYLDDVIAKPQKYVKKDDVFVKAGKKTRV
jgi:hypothetical protein